MATSTLLSLPASDLRTTASTASVVVCITVFVALLCACLVIGHLLEGSRWANESIASLLLVWLPVPFSSRGFRAEALWKRSRILTFDEELFFIYLLPPIIFNAGTEMTGLILMALHILVACVMPAADWHNGSYFLFKQIGITSLKIQQYLVKSLVATGAIFSATDSVCTLQVLNQDETPLLYSLVFGEGVANDATSIVLFNAVQSLNLSHVKAMTAIKLFGTFLYLFFTSTALGVMLLSLSGILTIFFCGIIMSHYTWHNVTEQSRITTRHAFAAMSFISETFIFLYVGMDALDIDKWKRSDASVGTTVAASGTLFALVMVGRAIFVFSLANFANCFRHEYDAKIGLRQQFVIWWAGLMRGSVTIALSYNQFSTSSSKEGAFMITNSIVVVLFSTVVFGSVTKPLIKAALCRNWTSANGEDAHLSSLEDIHILFPDNCRTSGNDTSHANPRSSLGMLIMHPTSTIHYLWRRFDDRYMRPVFGGRGFVPLLSSSTLTSPEGVDGV
ncbi:Sodium/hydrogen exchanger family [Musa troglodytarum]|uniref:Sodium/hydrogen exchanger family n=1 Tax=Musa troglodytarum TaxID=320322 RepID=A0A9E7JR93_9LILI|nr:Sodium/hydrogen exchanger family [Musa troglodytarum]